jgi:16S rRNA processing protein RimM
MRKEDCYYLGKITRTHGLAGNVVLILDTDTPEFYKKLESILIEINGLLVPFLLQKASFLKHDSLLLTFPNPSEQLTNQVLNRAVYLPLSTLPPLTGNKFYYHEVIGFEIVDAQKNSYGKIIEINDSAPQAYFRLNLIQKEVIVPIIKDWIIEVNRDDKTILMNLPEGLLDVFIYHHVNDEN